MVKITIFLAKEVKTELDCLATEIKNKKGISKRFLQNEVVKKGIKAIKGEK